MALRRKALHLSHHAQDLGSEWKTLIGKTGGWHYCGGVIKIQRAELFLTGDEKLRTFNSGITDAKYSYSRIDKNHPWSSEMAVTIARGYKGLDQLNKTFEYLDNSIENHPNHVDSYMMYGLAFYELKKWTEAKEKFEQANKITQGSSSQVKYYLGLTSLKLNDIESAKIYATEAAKLGYPLKGLQNLIEKLEKQSTN